MFFSESPAFRPLSSWIYDNTCAKDFHRLDDMTENSNSEDQERRGNEQRKEEEEEEERGREVGREEREREKEETPWGNCDAVEDEALQGLWELTVRWKATPGQRLLWESDIWLRFNLSPSRFYTRNGDTEQRNHLLSISLLLIADDSGSWEGFSSV